MISQGKCKGMQCVHQPSLAGPARRASANDWLSHTTNSTAAVTRETRRAQMIARDRTGGVVDSAPPPPKHATGPPLNSALIFQWFCKELLCFYQPSLARPARRAIANDWLSHTTNSTAAVTRETQRTQMIARDQTGRVVDSAPSPPKHAAGPPLNLAMISQGKCKV